MHLNAPARQWTLQWVVAWLLLVCALAPRGSVAQESARFSARLWQMEDGLPHSIVQAITQTRDGYLWVGTREGLARFDGLRFAVVPLSSGAPHPSITSLCESRDGSLWIGTEAAGLARLKDGVLAHYGRAEGLRSETVRALQEAEDGSLWIGSDEGLLQWKEGKFQLPADEAAGRGTVWAMSRGREGLLWAATSRGLMRIKGQSLTTNTLPEGLMPETVRGMFCGPDGTLWIGTTSGLQVLREGRFAQYEKGGGPAGIIDAILQDRAGNVWVGTYGGLNRLVAGAFIPENTDKAESYRVYALFEDREGSLWVGSEAGLARLLPQHFTTYTKKQGLTGNTIVSVCAGREGSVWIGAWGGGLNRWKEGRITTYGEAEGLSSTFVRALHEGGDGSLWVGTDYGGGLNRFKEGRFTHYGAAEGLATAAITAILDDAAGNLWVGSRDGLFRLTPASRLIRYTRKEGLNHDKINALCAGRPGVLWVGTEAGLTQWSQEQFYRPAAAGAEIRAPVLSLYEDSAGTLWIGTAGAGLGQLQGDKLQVVTSRQGLFSDTLYSILEDDRTNLWFNSSKGIFRVSKAQVEAVARGTLPSLSCTSYGKSDGILSSGQSQEATQWAACRATDGRLWFRTTQGAVVVDPAEITANELPPPIVIEAVLADKKAMTGEPPRAPGAGSAVASPPAVLVIPPGHGELEIRYTALSLRAAEQNRFRYQLAGVDSDWVEAGSRRFAYYANLAPGTYRFVVIGSNNDGVWNEAGAQVALVLQPHFWQTWWFFGGCAAVLAGAIAGAARYVTKRRLQRRLEQLERQRAIEQERTRIARDMHDELGARLTRISFQGGTAKRHLADPGEVERRIDQMSHTAREAVDSLHEIVWAVDPENDSLEGVANYICRYAGRFFEESPVECRLLIPPKLPPCRLSTHARHNLLLALKEALNNVLKHAAATHVQIRLAAEPHRLEILVTDDGKGFAAEGTDPVSAPATGCLEPNSADFGRPPAASARQPYRERSFGQGLSNMKNRLSALGGHCAIQSEPGEGTTIRLSLPLEETTG